MPKVFATENANRVPAAALWLTNIIVQLIRHITYFSRDAFALMLNLTSAMWLIPYLFVAAYGFKVSNAANPTILIRRASARSDHSFSRGGIYRIHDLCRRHEVHPALGSTLCARDGALHSARGVNKTPRYSRQWTWVIFAIAIIGALVGVYGLISGLYSKSLRGVHHDECKRSKVRRALGGRQTS